jgi:hypothetical protein
MNIESRLNKIEIRIMEKHKAKGDIVLYNEYGKVVDGVVIKMPTSEAEGLARLPEGIEQAIVYEDNWNRWVDVFLFDVNDRLFFLDDEPVGKEKIVDLTGKLIIRNSTCNILMVTPAGKRGSMDG